MDILNDSNFFILRKIINEMRIINLNCKKSKTYEARHFQSSVRICFPDSIAKYSISEGTKAVFRFNNVLMSKNEGKWETTLQTNKYQNIHKRESHSSKAGLLFSISPIRKVLKESFPGNRITTTLLVYAAGVLEFITYKIIELSGNKSLKFNKSKITPRILKISIESDDDLSILFKDSIISEGGVVPNTHPFLLPKKKFNNVNV